MLQETTASLLLLLLDTSHGFCLVRLILLLRNPPSAVLEYQQLAARPMHNDVLLHAGAVSA